MDPRTPPVNSVRRKKAEATRGKIIQAAHQEFIERGFHGATMAGIASRAGVASQTVYFVFHTKPELISAVIDAAVLGEEDPRPPQAQAWWTEMVAEPGAAEALRIFIRGAGDVFARAAAISEVLRAAALTDSEVRRTYQYHETLRRDGFGQVLEMLAGKGPLRDDRSFDELTDAFMTFYGDSMYNQLAAERGWTHEQIMAWLCDVLPGMLLAHPDSDGK
ncbi:AcrR family transcriptional regulator [Arthrobacter sp. V4I6]|uniref:TetR/AcrR family transcriptional regulator n=1 Tax=unclassified Arthrobacter TaxID=235627 RepID=UPI00278289E9|nr:MULTISPECIES: TetR/AcrR family transcriptional regulator [unclassified Arthrobacter]MDQ0822466.1 AcrR family transcriptional regulator [Arthrobacter sp. V1I7]MDQ0852093.1 AcrR family transcriptional regulator [Arthrobacter sp. V4I6]